MNKVLTFFLLFSLTLSCSAQKAPSKTDIVAYFGFEQKSIKTNGEEIVFYTYQKGKQTASKLIVYLQGSDPSPQFSYRILQTYPIRNLPPFEFHLR